jgi:IMP cyclohydrolase
MQTNETLEEIARKNLENLSGNIYPGRGIIVGMDELGQNLVQIYFITGRSSGSRNRIFNSDGERVFTQAADPEKEVGDTSLTLYSAMREDGTHFVVSNGNQTDAVITALQCRSPLTAGFVEGLARSQYEPDPSHTPRITGVCVPSGYPMAQLSILRKSAWGDRSDRLLYTYDELAPGFGFCITTYTGDGNPLPLWKGEPLLMPLAGDIQYIANTYWSALNEANRVSLVVKLISWETEKRASTIKIINRF